MSTKCTHNLTDAAASAMFKREPKSNSGKNHSSFQIQENKSHRLADNSERVSKMPYKTPWGKSGYYSGEVTNGIPNGTGRMRFKNGDQYDGRWMCGYSEQFLEKSRRTKRGFSNDRTPWDEKNMPDSRHIQKPDDYRHQDANSVLHPSQITMQPGYYQPAPLPSPYPPQYGNFLHQQQYYHQF